MAVWRVRSDVCPEKGGIRFPMLQINFKIVSDNHTIPYLADIKIDAEQPFYHKIVINLQL